MCLVKNSISEAKFALVYVAVTVEMNVRHVQLSYQTFKPLAAVYDCFHLVYLLLSSVLFCLSARLSRIWWRSSGSRASVRLWWHLKCGMAWSIWSSPAVWGAWSTTLWWWAGRMAGDRARTLAPGKLLSVRVSLNYCLYKMSWLKTDLIPTTGKRMLSFTLESSRTEQTAVIICVSIHLYSAVNIHASVFSPLLRHSPLHHSCPPGADGAQKCVLLPEQPRTLHRWQHWRVVDRPWWRDANAASFPTQTA